MSVSSIELLTNMCNYVRPKFFENLDYEPEGDTTMGRTMEKNQNKTVQNI
jgi:hypothetical protein